MCSGIVNKIIPFSSVDGPGNRTAIFLQGCNLNCLYCHNPETINYCNNCGICVDICPYNALSLHDGKVVWDEKLCQKCDCCLEACPNDSSPKAVSMELQQVIDVINKTKDFISGITVSGGECMLQTEFLSCLFKEVRKMGLSTFIDTNGTIPFYQFESLINVVDKVMIDMKSYSSQEHKMLTGKDNKVVFKNIEYLAKINKLYEVRTVIVPEVLNNFYNVEMISKIISELNPDIRYKLIRYRPMGVRTGVIRSYTPTDQMMEELANIAKRNGCNNVMSV